MSYWKCKKRDIRSQNVYRKSNVDYLKSNMNWSVVICEFQKPCLLQTKHLLSRGVNLSKIQQCQLCLIGPSFLHETKFIKFSEIPPVNNDEFFIQEIKISPVNLVCALINILEPLDIINNCSWFTKLQRIIPWCRRFIHNEILSID